MRAAAFICQMGAWCAMAPVHAENPVSVFGLFDSYLDASASGDRSAVRLQSGAISGSRLGLRGGEDLGNGTKTMFMLEAGVNVDDGTSGQGGILFGRQAWVGVSTRGGDLTLGRQYAPYFLLLATYGLGGGMAWGNASNYFTDNSVLRLANSIAYLSPAVAGFSARLFYALGENASGPGGSTGDVNSASLQYDDGRVSAAVAVENRRTTPANTDRYYAAGASYRFDVAKVALLAQARRDDVDAASSHGLEIGVQVPLGAATVLLDAGRFWNRSVADADATAYSLRCDYDMSRRTMLYAGVARIANEAQSQFGINGNTGSALAVRKHEHPRALITGVRHSF